MDSSLGVALTKNSEKQRNCSGREGDSVKEPGWLLKRRRKQLIPGKNMTHQQSPDDEAVKSKTSSGGNLLEHKPQWHCRVIGSWEPRIYEGLFGHRTVIGPVGYHLWWGNSETENKREDLKKEAAPEQTQQESRETQQEPSEIQRDLKTHTNYYNRDCSFITVNCNNS